MKKILFACAIAFTLAAITATAKPPMGAAEIHYKVPKPGACIIVSVEKTGFYELQALAIVDMPVIAEEFTNIQAPYTAGEALKPVTLSCYIPYWERFSPQELYNSLNYNQAAPTIDGNRSQVLRC